jgi:hypothetical protein
VPIQIDLNIACCSRRLTVVIETRLRRITSTREAITATGTRAVYRSASDPSFTASITDLLDPQDILQPITNNASI